MPKKRRHTPIQVTKWLEREDDFLSKYAGELNFFGFNTLIKLQPGNPQKAALFRSRRATNPDNGGKYDDERQV